MTSACLVNHCRIFAPAIKIACFQLAVDVLVVCAFYVQSRPTSSRCVRFASTADFPSYRRVRAYGDYWTQKQWMPGEWQCCLSCGSAMLARCPIDCAAGKNCAAFSVTRIWSKTSIPGTVRGKLIHASIWFMLWRAASNKRKTAADKRQHCTYTYALYVLL